jgi:hypothetical protein
VIPGDYKDFKANDANVKVEDGTLSVSNIQKLNEGYYLCEATNGIGSGLSAVMLISVQGEIANDLKLKKKYLNSNFQLHQALKSNCAIKHQGGGNRLFSSARLRVKNQLEFYGT